MRASCSAATWSRGVQLARSGAVVGEADEGDEIVLRVRLKAAVASPQVVLFPSEDEWSCDCNFREDACPHACAAAIALKQARDDGKPMPGLDEAGKPPHVAYRLQGKGKKLLLRRVLATEGRFSQFILLKRRAGEPFGRGRVRRDRRARTVGSVQPS